MSDKLKPFKAWAIIDNRKIPDTKDGLRVFKTRKGAEKALKGGGYVARVYILAMDKA